MEGGAASGQAFTAPVPRQSTKFNRTCSLLRQFIKERGTLGIDIQMTAATTEQQQQQQQAADFMRREAKPTMEGKRPSEASLFLPDLNVSGCASAAQIASSVDAAQGSLPQAPSPQLTIFYGGKVFVFDNVPQHKARQLMAAATAASGVSSSASALMMMPPGIRDNSHNPNGAADAATAPVTIAGHDAQRPPQHQIPIFMSGSDLPIARRVSLNRFLEKRKDRISSKAPYQVAGSPDSMSSSKPNHQQPSTTGSPSQSVDPSAAPSSSKPFPPQADRDVQADDSHMMPNKVVEAGKQILADEEEEEPPPSLLEHEEEDPSSSLPWLGLAPPPSRPPRNEN